MAVITHDARLAFDASTGAIAENVLGAVYLDTDTGLTTPLTVTVFGEGSPRTAISSDIRGVIPELTLDQAANGLTGEEGVRIVWASGAHRTVLLSTSRIYTALTTLDPARIASVAPSGGDDTAAIQAALDAAGADDVVRLVGAYTTSSTVTVVKNLDAIGATFNYTGSGIAVQVGSTTSGVHTQRLNVSLPHIIHTGKTGLGWGDVFGTTGVRISNLASSEVYAPQVKDFETGVALYGIGAGVSYVNLHLGHLFNNKVNMTFGGDAGGWANQNTIIGGRMMHVSAEGVQVAGTRHIVFTNSSFIPNGNLFLGTSLESPNVVEYHMETYGQYNLLVQCRFENTGGDASRRIWNRGTAKDNAILRGFNSGQITQVQSDTAAPWDVWSDVQTALRGGSSAGQPTLLLENRTGSANPVVSVMAAGAATSGADPLTAWTWRMTSQRLAGKRNTDTEDRVWVDPVNGRLYLGNAAAAPDAYLTGQAGQFRMSGHFYFVTDNTHDIGAVSSVRPRYVTAGTAVRTGSFATGSRPAAATAGAGAMVFDTTLGKPIWSTGSAWVDATGATV